MNIQKEFIPYEQALALKELGFDGACFSLYFNDGEFSNFIHAYKVNDEVVEKTNSVLAPTFSQAFRWLLEKRNLYAVVIPTVTMYWTFKTMTVVEGMVEIPPYNHVDAHDYSTRDEAELEALKRLIEIVKNSNEISKT